MSVHSIGNLLGKYVYSSLKAPLALYLVEFPKVQNSLSSAPFLFGFGL